MLFRCIHMINNFLSSTDRSCANLLALLWYKNFQLWCWLPSLQTMFFWNVNLHMNRLAKCSTANMALVNRFALLSFLRDNFLGFYTCCFQTAIFLITFINTRRAFLHRAWWVLCSILSWIQSHIIFCCYFITSIIIIPTIFVLSTRSWWCHMRLLTTFILHISFCAWVLFSGWYIWSLNCQLFFWHDICFGRFGNNVQWNIIFIFDICFWYRFFHCGCQLLFGKWKNRRNCRRGYFMANDTANNNLFHSCHIAIAGRPGCSMFGWRWNQESFFSHVF